MGDHKAIAATIELSYVNDEDRGYTRRRAGKGFSYRDEDGETIRDPEIRERIDALAIPPAWSDVWICPSPDGHIQATGRDDRERKQYIYHERWRAVRDAHKFDELTIFAEELPAIRARTDADLRKHGLPREKVLAGVVRLLEATLLRIGAPEYTRENGSYGLSTVRSKHVEVEGSRISFAFPGKGGIDQVASVSDQRLARFVGKCLDVPGYEVFKYLDENGERHLVDPRAVNDYLHDIGGAVVTAKKFRTWGGTLVGAQTLAAQPVPEHPAEASQTLSEAIEAVAARLGNTPEISRASYIHPSILDCYQSGDLQAAFASAAAADPPTSPHDLRPEEQALLAIIRRHPALDLV